MVTSHTLRLHVADVRKMPVLLKNFQNRIIFNEHFFKMQCNFLMAALGVYSFDMSVLCMSNGHIRHLNKVYRNVDEYTDVLSFPFHEDLVPGKGIPSFTNSYDYNLGDMTLGFPHINYQCQNDNTTLKHYLPVLVTHGLCHLLGYDHNTATNAKQMYLKEMSVLTQYNNTFGTNIKPLTVFE